jgi:Undecaprenyl-phosphate glucose phosphotransferase
MTNLSTSDIDGQAGLADAHHLMNAPPASHRRIESLVTRIVLTEFLALAGTCFTTSVAYFAVVLTQPPPTAGYVTSALFIALITVINALCLKQYRAIPSQSRDRYMWNGMGAIALAFSLFLSFLFVFKIGGWYSRGTFFLQFFSVSAAMLASRGTMYSYILRAIQSGTVEARRAVLIGDPDGSRRILSDLRRNGVRWVSILPLPSVQKNSIPGLKIYSNNIRTFVEKCRSFRPDDIMFLAHPEEFGRVAPLVEALSELPVSAHVIPIGPLSIWGAAQVRNFGGTATIQVLQPPLSLFDQIVKRGLDIVVSGAGLLVLSPLLFIVSMAIKLDSAGPVFFRQNRHGYNNDVIPVLKFRTMNVIESGETAKTFTQAKANDARITKLGRILRRTNIDELPQLLNVLRGEMSVVGPRPHPIALNTMFQERIAPFSRRHNVKPGLTGWAQVNGFRGETDTLEKMQGRVECDLFYIDNWSLMLDLKIIVMTLVSKSAYQNAF